LFGHIGRNYNTDSGYTPPGRKSSLIVEETRLCEEPTNTSVLFRLRSESAQPAGCFFYRETKDYLFVSNHLEMLLGLANGHKELDELCAANYLHTGAMAPGRTLAKGVFRVASNEELSIDTSRRKIEKRSLASEPCIPEITEGTVSTSALRALLTESIREQSSRRAIGVLLSGGIDSSVLAAISTMERSRNVDTLTICFGMEELDEDHLARETADYLGIRHRSAHLSAEAIEPYLLSVLSESEPLPSWTAIGHRFLVDFAAREGLEVLLSGLGSDELFFGYESMAEYCFGLINALPSELRESGHWTEVVLDSRWQSFSVPPYEGVAKFWDHASFNDDDRNGTIYAFLQSIHRAILLSYMNLYGENANIINYPAFHESHYRIPYTLLPSFTYYRGPAVSLAYPFLNHRIQQFAMALNVKDKIWYDGKKWWHKHIMYKLAQTLLPKHIWDRPKGIYTVPFPQWIRAPVVSQALENYMPEIEALLRNFFKEREVREWLLTLTHIMRGEFEPTPRFASQAWIALTLAAWLRRFK
jgi:asparagine synthase (glutamine-hydrolysing)